MTTATAASRLVLVPVKRTAAAAPAASRAPRRYQLARVKRPALAPNAEHLRHTYD